MKKKLVIFFLICVFLGGFFAYKFERQRRLRQAAVNDQVKIQTADQNSCASPAVKETKGECAQRIKDFDLEMLAPEMIKTIYVSKEMKEPYLSTNVAAEDFGRLLMWKGFNCSLVRDHDRDVLQAAQDFTDKLRIADSLKKIAKAWLENDMAGEYDSDYFLFSYNLALGDLNEICPKQLVKMCADRISVQASGGSKNEACLTLCARLSEYQRDKNKFLSEVANEDNNSGTTQEFLDRALMIYRFSGKDAALQVCGGLGDDSKKQTCAQVIYQLEPGKISCDDLVDRVKEFICDNVSK